MPKFSIITINFNNADGLEKTTKSILSQTFTDFEFIIIDGGSTDKSAAVMKNYQSRITYSVSEKDNGIYEAQNKGIAVAKGEYCLFLNSGDLFFSDTVLQKVFDSDLKHDVVYGNIMLAKDGLQIREKKYPSELSSYFLLVDNLAHPAQFIKRELFQKFGKYNTKYKIAADYEFFIRVFCKCNVTTRHLPFIISVFDLSGLSADKESLAQINTERHQIQLIYLPKMLVWIYHSYAALLQTRIYRWRWVAAVTNFFRGLVLKLIKVNNK